MAPAAGRQLHLAASGRLLIEPSTPVVHSDEPARLGMAASERPERAIIMQPPLKSASDVQHACPLGPGRLAGRRPPLRSRLGIAARRSALGQIRPGPLEWSELDWIGLSERRGAGLPVRPDHRAGEPPRRRPFVCPAGEAYCDQDVKHVTLAANATGAA